MMLAALCAFALAASAQGPEKELRAVEEQRYKAMLQADLPALEKLLADDLVYVHSSGSVETKAQFLDTVKPGHLEIIRGLRVGLFGGGPGDFGLHQVEKAPELSTVPLRCKAQTFFGDGRLGLRHPGQLARGFILRAQHLRFRRAPVHLRQVGVELRAKLDFEVDLRLARGELSLLERLPRHL